MSPPCRSSLLVLIVLTTALPGAARGQTAAPLDVVQTFAETISPGATVPVTIQLRNRSAVPVDDVRLIDDFPVGYEVEGAAPLAERSTNRLTWTVGRVAPGEVRRFQLKLKPRPEAPPSAFRNFVDVVYTARFRNERSARVAGPVLTLDIAVPKEITVGTPALLKINIRNQGDSPARNVSLLALLPAGLTHPDGADLESCLGTLEPRTERVQSLTVTPTRAGAFRAPFSVLADGVAVVVREASIQATDVRLTAVAGGPAVLPQELTGLFEVTVRNDGGQGCPVGVTISLPEGITFVRASGGGTYDRQSHTVHWELTDLRPGDRRALVWNGIGCQLGEMAYQVRLTSHDQVRHETTGKVRVVPGSATSN
jgi:uncharacterized repeat protein (TIGR01451 family)